MNVLLYTVQALALLTFCGFIAAIFIPKIRKGASLKGLFFKKSGGGYTVAFLLIYAALFATLFSFKNQPSPPALYYAGGALAILGLLIAFAGRYQLRHVWSPVTNTEVSGKLVNDGVFAYFRHPIYVGRLLFYTGVMCMLNLWGLALLPAYWLLLRRKSKQEERALLAGLPAYEQRMKTVRRWF